MNVVNDPPIQQKNQEFKVIKMKCLQSPPNPLGPSQNGQPNIPIEAAPCIEDGK